MQTPTRPAGPADLRVEIPNLRAPKLPADLLLLVALSLKAEPMSALVAAAKTARAS